MTRTNPPSPWVTAPIFFGLFFGGGYVGIELSHGVAPGSAIAEFVSFLMLPAAFVIGIVAWAGASILSVVRRLVRLGLKSDRPKIAIPPGSFAFVPAALLTSLSAGAVAGVLSSRLGSGWVLGLYAGLGLVYGVACWMLARSGFLPFPRE